MPFPCFSTTSKVSTNLYFSDLQGISNGYQSLRVYGVAGHGKNEVGTIGVVKIVICTAIIVNDKIHISDCDNILYDILQSINHSAIKCLPVTQSGGKMKHDITEWRENRPISRQSVILAFCLAICWQATQY